MLHCIVAALHEFPQVTRWMCQSPKLTSINLSWRVSFPPPLCSYLTRANLLSPFLRHRSINLFLLAYQRIWIETEEYSFEEKLVQDLAVSTCVCVPQCLLMCWARSLHFYTGAITKNTPSYHRIALSHSYTVLQPDLHCWRAWHQRWCQSQPLYSDHRVPSDIGKKRSRLDASSYQRHFWKMWSVS